VVAKKSRYLDKRTRALCVELARVTGNRRLEYCLLEPIAKSLGLSEGEVEAAAIDAVGRGWLLLAREDGSRSVCLTDAGRVWISRLTKK
jgi:hypothetical protein